MKATGLIAAGLMGALVLAGSHVSAAGQAEKKAAPAKKAAASDAKKADGGKAIELTADDTMKYNLTELTAKPGEEIHLKLTNKGTMPKAAAAHNFVLLKNGVDLNAFTTAAVMSAATDYIPAKFADQVIAHTKMAGPGETVEVTFKAPTAAGKYQFICSFPGHFATMKGTLTVAK